MKYITRQDELAVLPLSKRLYNCLRRKGLQTIGEMIDYPSQFSWSTIPNMGKMTIDEVNQWLEVIITGETGYYLIEGRTEVLMDANPEDTSAIITENVPLQTPIIDMPFSVRAKHCLRSAGITIASQLVGVTEDELLSLKNMGRKTAREILQIMEKFISQGEENESSNHEASKPELPSHTVELAKDLSETLGGDISSYLREIMEVEESYPGAQGETYYYRLYESAFMREALKHKILTLLEANEDGLTRKSLFDQLPQHLNNTTITEEILLELENTHAVAIGEMIITREYPTIIQALSFIKDDKHRTIFNNRLQGLTLEEAGSEYGLTRERVRQIINKDIRCIRAAQPRFYEDKYAYVFDNYHLVREDFQLAFDEPVSTYYYLDMFYPANKTNRMYLEDALNDDKISVPMRKQLEKVVYARYITVDGIRVKKERREMVYHFVRTRCRELTKYDDFVLNYHEWLAELDIQDDNLLLESKAYENHLNVAEYVLWNQWRRFRYYDIESGDYGELLDALSLSQYEDMEVSSLKFFRDYPELMQQYDILDEYELHNLLKKIWPKEDERVVFKKMPTIEIGKVNRDEQVLNLLLQYAPISADGLAAKYEEVYGVKATTVLANYMREFDEFYFDGMYTVDANNLPSEQFNRMQELLSADYHSIPDIKRIFLREFPYANASQINPYTLKTLGFKVYSGYVIKNTYPNAVEYFNGMLTNDDLVDARNIDKSLTYVQAYTGEANRLKRIREIVEFAPRQYINIRRLNECGITVENMEAYCKAVRAFVDPGEFFTIESIKQDGFRHELDDFGFDEWFYSSVLLEDREYFSVQRIGGTRIFYRGQKKILFSDLLEWIMESHTKIDIYDLCDLLENKYAINLSKDKIVQCIRNTDMYYDTIMEAVYIDYETYFEEV